MSPDDELSAEIILVHILGPDIADQIEPNAMLVEDLGADSLDLVELQQELLDRGISAPDDAFPSYMTVADLTRLILAPAP